LIGVLLTLSGCADEATVPEGPNLDALVEAYEHPTAELDADLAERSLGDVIPLQLAVYLADHLRFVSDAIDAATKGFGPDGLRINFGGEVKGRVAVRIVCPGEDPAARVIERDGAVELEAPIHANVLGPVLFGTARQCAFDFGNVPLPPWFTIPLTGPFPGRLDGPLALHVGQVSLGQPLVIAPLVSVEGTLAIEGLPPLDHFDFRVPAAATIETRVPLPDGTHAIAYADPTDIGLREKRGTWKCSVSQTTTCLAGF
jgi:hypothetical protein